ncbi:Fic/DOC family protein [Gordonia sp. C13]|uniref:Fic/DOC family protein n=1 Tax=Gordonia sp. C13 TaxID=2935078 RepID=UPI00200A4410|nr:Fic family protein [Gordonia sp. C13]MCK8615332.1 Fic family protein [Gordonia sp. C13]
MTAQDDWDATFIPGTTVLANKLGITDADALAAAEYTITAHREAMIVDGHIPIARTYDAEHLHTIHAALFSPIYEWAGVPRTYPLSKDGLPFADPNQIGRYLDHARDHIAAVDWTDLDHGGFAVEAATVYASINMSHPYREGNGRAAKVFMSQLADEAGYRLDYGRVTPQQWVNAAMLSHPDRGTFEPVPDTMVPVFARIAEPLTPQQSAPAEHAAARETDAQRAARIASRGTSRRSPTSGSRSASSGAHRGRGIGYGRRAEGREH